MRKIIFAIFSALPFLSSAQKISDSRWQDLFSYNNVLAICKDGERLIAAAENGIFYYHPVSGEISKLSKANGLHDVKISAFDYNDETKTGLIGYENGRLDVITPEGISLVVDVPLSGGYRGTKRINHISITGNQAAVSIGYENGKQSSQYALAIFDLEKKEFGQSVIMGEAIRKAAIRDEEVFVITDSALKSHLLNVTFPDPKSWNTIRQQPFDNLINAGGKIYYSAGDGWLYELGGEALAINGVIKNLSVAESALVVTFKNGNSFGIQVPGAGNAQKIYDAEINAGFYFDNRIYAASLTEGIITENNLNIKPDGPHSNISYKMSIRNKELYVSSGGRDNYNKQIEASSLGFYYFNGKKWIDPQISKSLGFTLNILDVEPNPANPKEVLIANYNSPFFGTGILLLERNDETFSLKKQLMIGYGSAYDRAVGFAFDENKNIFATIALINKTDYSGYIHLSQNLSITGSRSAQTFAGAQKPIYNNGFLWYTNPRRSEVIAINLNGTPQNLNDDKIYQISKTNNLPENSNRAIALAFDNNGDAWLGTDAGLRILRNANDAVTNNPKTDPVIISQNGLGEELFRDSAILQIAVDSGNRKWVSVDGGGVYYLSASGQQTIYHFTKENSPLPDNSVTDIKIDSSGKVYFVSHSGIVSFQGDTANVTENFSDVLVYPNPVIYTQYKGSVHLKGLAEKTNIRITDAAGNLVHQAVARGGTYEWDLTSKGKRVASGIYFVLMTNADGTDKASAKIAVVN